MWYSLEIDVTAFKKLILSSAVADEKLKKLHCQVRFKIHKITINVNPTFFQSPLSAVTTTKLIQKEKSKLDKNVSEFLIWNIFYCLDGFLPLELTAIDTHSGDADFKLRGRSWAVCKALSWALTFKTCLKGLILILLVYY